MSVSAGIGVLVDMVVRAAEKDNFDPNSVTPGVIGFFAIFIVAVIVVLIALDLNRRVRRVNYREQIRERLEAEVADSDADATASDADATAEPEDKH